MLERSGPHALLTQILEPAHSLLICRVTTTRMQPQKSHMSYILELNSFVVMNIIINVLTRLGIILAYVIIAVTNKLIDNPYEFQVHLVGGDSPSSGLLKVYANDQWGAVCSSGFTSTAADSACRQLGYTNSLGFSVVPL